MKYPLAILILAVAMVLMVISLPWFVLGTGLSMMGRDEGDGIVESSPVVRWFEFLERHL